MTMSLEAGYSVTEYRWESRQRRCRNPFLILAGMRKGVPSLSVLWRDRAGEVGMGPWHVSTSADARAHIYFLYLSAMNSLID